MSNRLLNAEQAAELIDMSESWVRRETRKGRIPHIPLGAKAIRYDAEQLEAWWRARARGPVVPVEDLNRAA